MIYLSGQGRHVPYRDSKLTRIHHNNTNTTTNHNNDNANTNNMDNYDN